LQDRRDGLFADRAPSAENLNERVARDGYSRIAAKFGAEDAFGPHTVSLFLGESGGFDDMSPEQFRVDAYRQVRAWLEALGLTQPSREQRAL
jgi:hypothetical protein